MAVLKADHQLRLLKGSKEFFAALVAAMDASLHEVRLETYIFHPQATGEQIAQALVRAAQRGVTVCVVMDGVGTPTFPSTCPQRFDAGSYTQLDVYKRQEPPPLPTMFCGGPSEFLISPSRGM